LLTCALADDIVLGQLMIASVVSTIGEPFRKEWYTNRWLVYSLIIQLAWLLYQVFAGSGYFPEELLGLEPIPTYFGFIILGLIAANAFLAGLLWMFAGRACRSYQRGVKRPAISQAATLPSSSKGEGSSPMKQNESNSQRVENKMKQYSGLGEAEEASPLLKK
jgi:hypothetical protein